MQVEQPVAWQAAPSTPRLEKHQIHVWRLRPERAAASDAGCLGEAEQARLAAMSSALARADYLALRLALRGVLAGYAGCRPAEVALTVSDGGKPAMRHGPQFNLSHCGELALLAVAPVPVGIDLERLREVPNRLAIARRVLGEATAQELAALPAVDQNVAFLRRWTAMEARQKCYGEGVFGRRVDAAEVAMLAFRPDEEHLAQLAWPAHSPAMQIRWYAQRS